MEGSIDNVIPYLCLDQIQNLVQVARGEFGTLADLTKLSRESVTMSLEKSRRFLTYECFSQYKFLCEELVESDGNGFCSLQ